MGNPSSVEVSGTVIDLSLAVFTVLASLVVTGLAAGTPENVSRWLIATIAAIPAAAVSVGKIVAVRERSNWYFMYAARVRSLSTR